MQTRVLICSPTATSATPRRIVRVVCATTTPTEWKADDDDAQLSVFDFDKEEGRKYRRRDLFFALDLLSRGLEKASECYTLHASRIASAVVAPVIWVTGVSVVVGSYETALSDGVLPSVLPTLTVSDPDITGLASFALSLLLAYRTSSSYRRWEEARALWGSLLNRSRDLLRQFLIFAPNPDDNQLVATWIIALSYSLMWMLRTEHKLTDLLSQQLSTAEMHILEESPHKPMFCLQMLSRILARSRMDEVEQLQLQNNLTEFEDIIGGCERIYTSPIPLSYTRHTTRFLMIWLTGLPFAFWQTCSWGIVIILPLTAALLVGIEEIGVQIEEPFGILPLEDLCEKLKRNVAELMKIDDKCQELLEVYDQPTET